MLKKNWMLAGLVFIVPMVAQAQDPGKPLFALKMGVMDSVNGITIDPHSSDVRTRLRPYLDSSSPQYIGISAVNAITEAKNSLDSIGEREEYKSATAAFAASCPSDAVLPQPTLIVTISKTTRAYQPKIDQSIYLVTRLVEGTASTPISPASTSERPIAVTYDPTSTAASESAERLLRSKLDLDKIATAIIHRIQSLADACKAKTDGRVAADNLLDHISINDSSSEESGSSSGAAR